MCRIAMLSVHGCPLDLLGAREAGGMQVYVRELSRHLGRLGQRVDVYTRLTRPDIPAVVSFGENARVIHLPAGDLAPMDKNDVLAHLPRFVGALRQFAAREGLAYQYIHSHYWLSGWVGAALAERCQLPHVATFHTLDRLKNQSGIGPVERVARVEVERRVVATADAVVASTEHERVALADLYDADSTRVHVIPPGVDRARFQPVDRARARAALGLGEEPTLVFVGRLDPVKNIDTLLHAVALLHSSAGVLPALAAGGGRPPIGGGQGPAPAPRLLILGGNGKENGDAEAHRLRELAADLGLANRVDFVGPVEQDDLPTYYSAADACVIPSHYESFGLVALEALACGTPVVASAVGGLPTIVEDGRNGLLVADRSAGGFAAAIGSLLSDEPLQRRLRAGARPSSARFGWDQTARRVVDLYHGLGAAATPRLACVCDR